MKSAKQICLCSRITKSISVTVHHIILSEILVHMRVGFFQQDYELQYLFVHKNSNLICVFESIIYEMKQLRSADKCMKLKCTFTSLQKSTLAVSDRERALSHHLKTTQYTDG